MNDAGLIEVWLRPVVGHDYIVGVDTADGIGRDRSAAAVLHRTSYSIDALLVSDRLRPFDFANKVHGLALAYNQALIIPEADARGLAVINLLLERKYWNLWRRQDQDKAAQSVSDRVGWHTTLKNKHVLLDELRRSLPQLKCWSKDFVEECSTFITDMSTSGRELLRAQTGCHDDIVMAVALANFAHRRLPIHTKWAKPPRKPDTDERWADQELESALKRQRELVAAGGDPMGEQW